MMKTFVILFALLVTFQARAASQAPFQVSIQWKDLYGVQTEPFQLHICSGIIIHEKYILTTASCLLTPIINTDFSRLMQASELTVIAGFRRGAKNDNSSSTSLTERNVVSIIPHNKFTKTTFDSDIAVLKLDRALPLVNNTEIQWLDIATGGVGSSANDSCFSTVFNTSSQEFYSIVKSPSNLQHWLCEGGDANETTRKMDLCLEYLNAAKENCNSSSQSLHYSRERGTAYICNNKLIAILADINHPKNAEICSSTRRTTAFYVNATMHLEWLLSEDMGITNLGMKNRSDSQNSSSWSSTTEASAISTATTPPKKNSCEKINENLLILLFLAGAVLVFSNGFDKI